MLWKKEGFLTGIKACLIFLLGMFLPWLPFLVYFSYNHGLKDLFQVYFYNNLFSYSSDKNTFKILFLIRNVWTVIRRNKILSLASILGFYHLTFNKKTTIKSKIYIIASLFGMYLFIFAGGKSYLYYPLPLFIYSIFGFLPIQTGINRLGNTKAFFIASITVFLVLIYGYAESCNTYLIMQPKSDMWMYKFADQMSPEGTLLNYGELDLGLYTVSGKLPGNKYFCKLNINLDEMIQGQNLAVEEGKTDYVVTRTDLDKTEPEILKYNYKKIAETIATQDGRSFRFLLYKHK